MWPSLPVATSIADVANIVFIASLGVGVAATIVIVWMANVKESHWDREREQARERIIGLETQQEKARADAEKARADIAEAVKQTESAKAIAAEANKKAEEEKLARLKIEERLAGRRLTATQQRAVTRKLRPFTGEKINVYGPPGNPEVERIANGILQSLTDSGWVFSVIIGQDMARVVSGILIELNPDAPPPTLAAAQVTRFGARGREFDRYGSSTPAANAITGAFVGTPIPDAKIRMTIGSQ
jgi:hypothetical protein